MAASIQERPRAARRPMRAERSLQRPTPFHKSGSVIAKEFLKKLRKSLDLIGRA